MATTNSVGVYRVAVVIPAAGRGSRMGTDRSKTLLQVGGISIVERSARVFLEHPQVERVVIAARSRDFEEYEKIFPAPGPEGKVRVLIKGGKVRQNSVWRGLSALEADPPEWLLVHDGARPFCSSRLLGRVLDALQAHPAVVPVLPLTDTVRSIERGIKNGARSRVLDREKLFRSQTPQGFHWDVIREAFIKARAEKFEGTDDAQLVEAAGHQLHFVCGEESNIKITNPEDLIYARWALQESAVPGAT